VWAECRECGEDFWREPHERWKRLCLDCWRDRKNREDEAELEELQDQVKALRERNARLESKIEWLEECLMASEQRKCPNPICEELIKHQRFLLKRVHPDVNDGIAEATHVTRLLLDLKERAGALA
jgi:hypothetical protein